MKGMRLKLFLAVLSVGTAVSTFALPGDMHVWVKFRRTGAKPAGWVPSGRERFWGQWNDLNFERTNGKNLIILNMRYQESLPDLVNADGSLKLTAPEGYEYGGDFEKDFSASLPGVPQLERMKFNNPGLTVPVGVGLTCCPIVTDFDGDGVLDVLLSCECRRWNNTHFFRNLGKKGESMPTFAKGEKVGISGRYPTLTSFNGTEFVQAGRTAYHGFRTNVFQKSVEYRLPDPGGHINEISFSYRDFDGDGKDELVMSGDVWENVAWHDAYESDGVWTGGHLQGWTWISKNREGDLNKWDRPVKLTDVNGKPLTTDGPPRAMFEDFDGDGDLDLIGGSFYNEFTYFENVGTRTAPKYAPGRKIFDEQERELVVDSPLMTPISIDWNGDGKADIVCGDEAGYVSLLENTGKVRNGTPVFKAARYFRQKADHLKYGCLATPASVDWDGDGDLDLIAGNAAGYIAFIENLSGPGVERPKWAEPKPLSCTLPKDGSHPDVTNKKHSVMTLDPFRIVAGPSGSIQGPRERMWGYVCLSVADWDGDGLPDVMINNTLGRIFWFRNVGTRRNPKLEGPLDVEVEWKGAQPELAWGWIKPKNLENPKSIMTQWRTTPVMTDWDGDGLVDLLLSDVEGYLCLWKRARRADGTLALNPPERVFRWEDGRPIRLNGSTKGQSGRGKICVVDWDGDGKVDILKDSNNATWWRQVKGADGKWSFRNMGAVAPNWIQWHSTCPCPADFDGNGIPDLVVTGEDGLFYYMRNPYSVVGEAKAKFTKAAAPVRTNLLKNPSFDGVFRNGAPEGWTVKVYKGKNPYSAAHGYGINGSGGVKYENSDLETHVALKQRVKVEPGKVYAFECWVRPDGLTCKEEGATSVIEWHDAKGRRLGGTGVPNGGIRGKSADFQVSRPHSTPRLPADVATAEVTVYVNPKSTGVCYIDDALFCEATPPPVDQMTCDAYRATAADGDVTFFAGLDLDSSGLAPEDVEGAFVFETATRGTREVAARKIEQHRAMRTVRVRELALGANTVRFVLKSRKTGAKLGETSMTFTRTRQEIVRKVSIDRYGRTIVDGKPFFPFGMYSGRLDDAAIARYAESVFNCVMPYTLPTEEVMDKCWAKGVRMLYDIRNSYANYGEAPKWVQNDRDEFRWLSDTVRKFGAHPGLLAWYNNDEIDVSMIDRLAYHQNVMEILDPNHPTWTTIYQVGATRGYLPSCDIIGTDPYPIGDTSIGLVVDWTRKTNRGFMGARALWQVPQTFDWAYYRKKRGGSLEGLRFPTRDEMLNMTWQAIAAGANGIVYYAFHDVLRNDPDKADARWADVKSAAAEIWKEVDTLLSAGPVPEITGETATIVARAYNVNGKIRILVVNASDSPGKAELKIGGKPFACALKPLESKWTFL